MRPRAPTTPDRRGENIMAGKPQATLRLVLGTAMVLLLAGCGRVGMDDLQAFVEEVRARPPGKVEPLPELKPYEAFVYQAFELRSPFTSSAGMETEQAGSQRSREPGLTPDFSRRREVTEQYPLDSLRMVGHIEKDDEVWALVQAPDGVIHRIRPGNYLGQNHGRVTRVTADRVDLMEIVPDGLGGWMERQASVALGE